MRVHMHCTDSHAHCCAGWSADLGFGTVAAAAQHQLPTRSAGESIDHSSPYARDDGLSDAASRLPCGARMWRCCGRVCHRNCLRCRCCHYNGYCRLGGGRIHSLRCPRKLFVVELVRKQLQHTPPLAHVTCTKRIYVWCARVCMRMLTRTRSCTCAPHVHIPPPRCYPLDAAGMTSGAPAVSLTSVPAAATDVSDGALAAF